MFFTATSMIPLLINHHFRQLPGNLVLRKVGVRNWLACMVVGWGAVQLGMGFVPTWGYLTLCRILLGMFEVRLKTVYHHSVYLNTRQAPFFPALAFIIATWYVYDLPQT